MVVGAAPLLPCRPAMAALITWFPRGGGPRPWTPASLRCCAGTAPSATWLPARLLFADGDETYDLIVMLDGTAEIIQGYDQPGARLIAGYGRSQFLGEIGRPRRNSPRR
jgi:hypothetical protein